MIKTLIGKSLQYYSISSCKYSLARQNQLCRCCNRLSATNFFQNNSLPKNNKLSMDSTILIGNDEELRSKALKLCKDHLGGPWCRISSEDLSLMPISGGMSNSLFCCSLPESTELTDGVPQQVLLRFYGDIARDNDIAIQLEIFSLLSSKELGPKLYGKFEDGRLEEFLPANSMTCEELMDQEISLIIAKKLAAIHSLDIPITRNKSWLLDRFNEWIDCIKDGSLYEQSDSTTTTQSTKDIAQELLVIDYKKEVDFLQAILKTSPSPLVFSHNDLHQGNILLAKYSKRRPTLEERIVIIDFEYCSYNYRAYDIANHFCEWCFEYDTPEYPHFNLHKNRFPSKIVQRNFIRQYLMQDRHLTSCNLSPEAVAETASVPPTAINTVKVESFCDKNNNGDRNLPINGSFHLASHSNGAITEKEVDDLLEEVQPFFMIANLLWTLWCIKSARSSSIKFGYWEHAMARWSLYSNFKTTYLAHRSEASGDCSSNHLQLK